MGELGTVVDGDTLQFQHLLPGPIETVWEYLTNADFLRLWLADARIEHREGGWVDLLFDVEAVPERKNGGAHIVGSITDYLPPSLIAYSWNDADHPDSRSHVRFELMKQTDKVRITITHTGLQQEAITACSAGWHTHVSILDGVLKGQEPKPFRELFAELQSRYEQEKTMPPKA